jgi:hypothetical protein
LNFNKEGGALKLHFHPGGGLPFDEEPEAKPEAEPEAEEAIE